MEYVLFVHRDAENKPFDVRLNEIKTYWHLTNLQNPKMVPIIPIKMTESWLLIDKNSIKVAAGNRKYKGDISLPNFSQLEEISDPKEQLFKLLKQVSELKGRRLIKFNIHKAIYNVGNNIKDFSTLRRLSGFQRFENEVKNVISELGYLQ